MRILGWMSLDALVAIIAAGAVALLFVRNASGGFSARADPSAIETLAARTARSLALPEGAREKQNPVPRSADTLRDAMAHWADHCAICHGNDGSGHEEMGMHMYPHAPDMRKDATQKLTDGELFYIIENVIRLTGMPGWGGTESGAHHSWKLVHFIRHLYDLSPREIGEMEKLDPKSPDDREHEQQEQDFLNG